WINLYVALNEMNRSMGLADAYPFVLSPTIVNKLSFIHKIITGA
ncbi:MAG TPA: putative zinc-binding metallopeptidase, partial [Gammaproteobacteria bacterium]